MKNYFIVFEGPDGVGKTTIINALAEMLKKEDLSVEIVNTGLGFIDNAISELKKTKNGLYDFNAHFLLATSNSILTYKQKNNSGSNTIYLVDRYIYTTIAYNCALGFDFKLAEQISKLVPVPDIVFLFCLNTNILLKRKKQIESIEVGFKDVNLKNYIDYQNKVIKYYDKLCNRNNNFIKIDTENLENALKCTKHNILKLIKE